VWLNNKEEGKCGGNKILPTFVCPLTHLTSQHALQEARTHKMSNIGSMLYCGTSIGRRSFFHVQDFEHGFQGKDVHFQF